MANSRVNEDLIVFQLPVRRPEDWLAIRQMLRENDLLIPGNYKAEDPYDLRRYLYSGQIEGRKFQVLFDRNLVSRLVSLAKGKALSIDAASSKIFRLTSACLAFCILAEILVEPNMALYEYASSSSHEDATSDYKYFLMADNADPRCYIDIALGRADRLPEKHLSDLENDFKFSSLEVKETNFKKMLNMWKPHYLYVLKVVSLIHSGMEPFAAAKALLQWQAFEAYYNAAATLFCLAAISYRPPSGGMIKKIKSSNVSELEKGIRNATWDICLVSQWGKWIRQSDKTFWAFSSNDVALKAIARSLFTDANDYSHERTSKFLRDHWGERDGNQLMKSYIAYSDEASRDHERRNQFVDQAFSKVDEWIWQLEEDLGIKHST